jgi:oxaloacetate decarboxylase alpha subunit
MIGTMRRQLAESRLSHLEPRVIEELGRVRQELGWPIVMTPFAQMLLAQAVINVSTGERYSSFPDEIIRYALGRFGRPNVPIDGKVMDRIHAQPRTRELAAEPPMDALPELRRRIGADLSDEEFLLRATMPAGLVDAMRAAGAARRDYDPRLRPVMRLLRELAQHADLDHLTVEKPGFRLRLARR